MKKLLVMMLLAAVAGSASAALVTFIGDGNGNRVDWEDINNWQEPVGRRPRYCPIQLTMW